MMKTYNQLTYEQRCQVSILIEIGISQQVIADMVGVSQPTISRELKRDTVKNKPKRRAILDVRKQRSPLK